METDLAEIQIAQADLASFKKSIDDISVVTSKFLGENEVSYLAILLRYFEIKDAISFFPFGISIIITLIFLFRAARYSYRWAKKQNRTS